MKKVYLSDKRDSKILGVCAGIGEAYDVDPSMIRIGVILLAVCTAGLPVLIAYLVAWAILPAKGA
jgi:phage shock protein C